MTMSSSWSASTVLSSPVWTASAHRRISFSISMDVVTRRRLEPVVVALIGAGAYVAIAVALVLPSDDLPIALLVAGPGLLGAATLKIVPLEM